MRPFRRAGRRTNLALLVLLVLSLVSGVLAFGIGTTGPATVVVVAHGAAGLGLLLLVPWKSVVARRGWRGNVGRRAPGAVLLAMVVLVVGSGLLHSLAGFRSYLWLTPMQVHVGAAVIAAVALVAHLRVHPSALVPRRADLSRRAVLRTVGLGAGAAAIYGAVEGVAAVASLPGSSRRATGSHELGSRDPAAMPITQWFTDPVLDLDPDRWRLQVAGRSLTLAELRRGDDVLRATLDCTNGWYASQEWRGIRLDGLLGDAGGVHGRSVDVTSATGYSRRLPLRDARHLLLATHVEGRPLSAGHGAPLRLVAPGRRGFWWVKWVVRVEVVDAPWWVAIPFPVQ